MAEALGAAVLTVTVDDRQLRAGLLAIQQDATRTAQLVQQAFSQAAQAARQPIPQPTARPAPPPPIPPELLRGLQATETAGGRATGAIRALGTALAGLGAGAAVFGFLKGSVTAATELETITRKLANTLGQQGAGAALAFTRGLSDELGLSFKSLSGAFGSFTAAATAASVPLETQKNLFAAVAKAGQSLGLSNFEVEGSLLALQQVAAKGTVQMEELRGQLGERLPIALSATARGLGVSQKELIKLVESGQLTADRFFPALTKGLNELTAQAGGIPTAAQNFQKLANAWDDLQTSFGTSLLPAVTEQVKNLAAALEGLKVGVDANKLGLGGLFGFLGLVPKQAQEAVGRVRGVAKLYNLTEKEARALFYDSAKQSGMVLGGTGLIGSAKQLEQTLDRLPDLARQFRERNPDVTAQKNAKAARDQAEAQRLLKESETQQARNRLNTAATLRRLEIDGINNRTNAAQKLSSLEGVELVRLQNKLALQDRLLERKRLEVQLADELSKPKGAGDGKGGTQSTGRIAELRDGITKVNAEIRSAGVEAGIALIRAAREAAATTREVLGIFRERQDALLASSRQIVVAGTGLRSPVDVVTPEDAVREGRRRVAAEVFDLRNGLVDARTDAVRAEQALADSLERRRSGELIPDQEVARLLSAADTAGGRFAALVAESGRTLIDSAVAAGQQLRSAQAGFNDLIRGNADVFSPALVNEQLRLARAEFQPLVDRGVIRQGIPIGTPEQVFGLASLARQFTQTENNLRLAEAQEAAAREAVANTGALVEASTAISNLRTAIDTLSAKSWVVDVNVQPPSAALPNV